MATFMLLADTETSRILAASLESGSINLLQSVDPTTTTIVFNESGKVRNRPKAKSIRELAKEPNVPWCEFYYDAKANEIVHDLKTPDLSQGLRHKAAVYQAKFAVLSSIAVWLNGSRKRLIRPALYEDTTRAIRGDQARRFRKAGYDDSLKGECAFVWQYAEVYGIPPKEAADRLIAESEVFEAGLLKAEGIKLRYWKRVLETDNLATVAGLRTEFERDFHVNPRA